MGAAALSAPTSTALAAEEADRATCLYETEWQVADSSISSAVQQSHKLPGKLMTVRPAARPTGWQNTLIWDRASHAADSLMVSPSIHLPLNLRL